MRIGRKIEYPSLEEVDRFLEEYKKREEEEQETIRRIFDNDANEPPSEKIIPNEWTYELVQTLSTMTPEEQDEYLLNNWVEYYRGKYPMLSEADLMDMAIEACDGSHDGEIFDDF